MSTDKLQRDDERAEPPEPPGNRTGDDRAPENLTIRAPIPKPTPKPDKSAPPPAGPPEADAGPYPAEHSALTRRPILAAPGGAAGVDALACLAFALFAAYVTIGLWPDPATRVLVHNQTDHAVEEWFMAHATLLWTGDFSMVTDRMNAPDGINLMVQTSMQLLGVIMSPVTLLFGAPVSFALLTAGNLAGTAAAWYLLLTRALRLHRLAAFLGALLCGFAPGMISQAYAHIPISAGWLVPALVWCVIRLANGRRPVATGLVMAALVVAHVFIGEEVLFLTALSLAVFTLVYALADRRRAKAAWRPMVTGLAVAAVTAGTLLAYPLWLQFAGPQSIPNGVFSSAYFSADLASLPAFSPLSLAGDDGAARLGSGVSEYNTFLGWPLLLVTVVAAGWMWRVPAALASSVTAVVMLALSLGPEIVVDTVRTGIPGPFHYFADVAGLGVVIEKALPTRFALAAIPALAMLLTLAVHRALTERAIIEHVGELRYVVASLLVAVMIPIAPAPLPTAERTPVPAFVLDGHWRKCVRPGGVLVPVPVPNPEEADTLRWATAAHARFGVPQGYFIAPYGAEGRASVGVYPQPTTQLLDKITETGEVPPIGDEERGQARADVAHWRASCVALDAGAGAVPHADALRRALVALYGPEERIADAWVWRV